MNILVTGASGFLGHQIVLDLIKEGHQVFNLSRSTPKELTELGVSTLNADLRDLNSLENIFSKYQFDAVFHAASKVGMWGKWQDFYDINFTGSKNIFDISSKNHVKYFIYTSTPSVVFDFDDIIDGDESLPYAQNSMSLYAKSKILAEKYILNTDSEMKVCALRPHLIYGKRDQNIIPRLIEARRKNKLKIIGNGNNIVDVIHVENASLAHILAFKELQKEAKNNKKAYFIAQEKPVLLWKFIDQILETKGLSKVTSKINFSLAFKIGFFIEIMLKLLRINNVHPPMTRFVALQLGKSHYFSHDNAWKDFGYKPLFSVEESLKKI